MRWFVSVPALVLGSCVNLIAAQVVWAGPAVLVGSNVPQQRRVPVDRIDHAEWDSLLKRYVDQAGYVDYRSWKASMEDQQRLDAYLNRLSAASFPAGSSREALLAFWINAYNALTVKGILREYPTSSIRNHTPKLFGYNIWQDLQLVVAGRPISLEAIEHTVLRKMGESRIHFAIVCASIGCPRLLNEAYAADRLDEQLSANARAFFSDRAKFTVDAASKTVWVSPILDWFAEDFGADTAARLRAIAPYVPDAARPLVSSGSAQVRYLDYDWGLNERS